MLAGVGTLLLSRFPTSLEDDRKLLQESGAELSRDMRLALSFRMEKKQVLSELLQDIAHRIRVGAYPKLFALGCGLCQGPMSVYILNGSSRDAGVCIFLSSPCLSVML